MSIDDRIAQNKADMARLADEGKKLQAEKEKAERPKFGDILETDGSGEERVALYDAEGCLRAYDRKDGLLHDRHRLPSDSMYTRTGRNIAEALKTT